MTMPEPTQTRSSPKTTIAVLKAGPEFREWLKRFRDHLRLPAAHLLDAALVQLAKAKGFEEPPPR